jgi:hypothetical protein
MSQLELLLGASLFKTFKPFEHSKASAARSFPRRRESRLFHAKTENETWMPAGV